MRKIITRARAIQYAICVICALLTLAVYPCRLFRENIQSTGRESPAGAVSVGGDYVALQEFTAEYDRISSIGFYLKGDHDADTLTLRVFKESTGELLREITVSTDEFHRVDDKTYSGMGEGYADVYVNLETKVGDGYFYTVEGLSSDFEIPFEMTANSGTSNNGYMQYGGENKEAYNLVTRYVYVQPLRKLKSLCVILALLAAGCILTLALGYAEKRSAILRELTTPAWIIRAIANPVIVALAITAIVAVGPLHMFTIFYADIVFMILGILLLAGVLLYAVNVSLPGTDFRIGPIEKDSDRPGRRVIVLPSPQAFLQSLFIAIALKYCVDYVNALYEVFHDIAWRKMAFFLGLALIVTFSFKELVNAWNLILLIAGVITARVYYVHNLPDMVDEFHVDAMFGTCLCIPVIFIMMGFIIARCVRWIMALARPSSETGTTTLGTCPALSGQPMFVRVTRIVYDLATIMLVAGMIMRRNGRYWQVMMAVIGAVYFFRLAVWDHSGSFTDNLTRGILFHFAGAVIYCLMFRPYEAFEYVRFPFVFHTVTITAEYMALVMAASIVRLFSAYRRRKRLMDCKWELFVFGCVASYTLFTMSRTAMIGIVATGLTMWIAYSRRDNGHGRIRGLLVSAGGVVLSVMVAFPIFFSAQKAIPGLVGQPRLLEIERYPQPLMISKDYDSEEYITITRFAKAFAHKMFGLDEDLIKWDLYTIYGKTEGLYVDYTYLLDEGSAERAAGFNAGFGPTLRSVQGTAVLMEPGELLLSGEGMAKVSAHEFVPPHEYGEEGDPPEEWWDEDYWVYYPQTGEWEFATWKLEEEAASDVTNGRLDIFRSYLEQMNDEGHEEMGATLPNGEIAAHAHNIYLQVAYDNGKIIGIMFIIWMALTCIRALTLFIRNRDKDPAAGILLSVSVTYAVCGVTEWISHPCNPVGMVMMLVCAVLCLPDLMHEAR